MEILLLSSKPYLMAIGVTPFFKIILPYFAVSPVMRTAKACFALS